MSQPQEAPEPRTPAPDLSAFRIPGQTPGEPLAGAEAVVALAEREARLAAARDLILGLALERAKARKAARQKAARPAPAPVRTGGSSVRAAEGGYL